MPSLLRQPITLPDPDKGDFVSGGSSTRGSHRLATASTCEIEYALSTIRRLEVVHERDWTILGSLIHLCAAYHSASRMKSPPPWYLAKTLDQALAEKGVGRQDEIEQAKKSFEHWTQIFSEDRDPMRPMYVETEFGCVLRDILYNPSASVADELITARLDRVDEDPQGDLWLVDVKTKYGASRPRLPSWNDDRNEHRLAFQIHYNLHIARAFFKTRGRTVRGFIVERIKQLPPYDVDRNTVQIPPLIYEQTPKIVEAALIAEQQIADKIRDRHRLLPTGSLHGACTWCDFADGCRSESHESRSEILAGPRYRKKS